MKTQSLIILALAVVVHSAQTDESKKKDKRGVSFFGSPGGFDIFGVVPSYSSAWAPGSFGPSGWSGSFNADLALGQIQSQATHDIAQQALRDPFPGTPSIAYTPEVLRAVQQAKEANNNVLIAQHRVSEVKQAAIIQQKIALAREAAAREATKRCEEILAHAQAEARASAQQLVSLQQRLATLKDTVAAAQRVAAARETAAAAAIQKNASETAAELRKQDADKQIHQSEKEAKARDIVAAKENAIANAVQQQQQQQQQHISKAYHPWG